MTSKVLGTPCTFHIRVKINEDLAVNNISWLRCSLSLSGADRKERTKERKKKKKCISCSSPNLQVTETFHPYFLHANSSTQEKYLPLLHSSLYFLPVFAYHLFIVSLRPLRWWWWRRKSFNVKESIPFVLSLLPPVDPMILKNLPSVNRYWIYTAFLVFISLFNLEVCHSV